MWKSGLLEALRFVLESTAASNPPERPAAALLVGRIDMELN
jgi:hypothetical protein